MRTTIMIVAGEKRLVKRSPLQGIAAMTTSAGNAFQVIAVVLQWSQLTTLEHVRRSHVEPRGR
jgi:hypothetical protein